MRLCSGYCAAHSASAVVGPDNIIVFHAWQKYEVVVMRLRANIDNFSISAEFVPGDDAIRVLWWSPANLH